LYILNNDIIFPDVTNAYEDGLLAIGGDLSVERLLLAYQSGIFPWYSHNEPIMWYSPNPRFVLFPEHLKISKSMLQVMRKNTFSFTTNTAFAQVIQLCKTNNRKDQDGTWITNEMELAYNNLHQKGIAISAETWCNNQLVGGLYGVLIDNVFCGESMFALQANASKFAFINFVQLLQKQGVSLIDCQVYTEHLESLGAVMISRDLYMKYLINKNAK
jgi:leucyl/phenylalanyl-tRNA---protein transferase